jgi:CheY-like chemotaxis protein
MPDRHPVFPVAPAPTPDRPLAGFTLLLVEDSRCASEAVRLLGLRCGARIRRADSLRSADGHLAAYRPAAVLVDLGLPDGSGLDLIARLASAVPRLPAILAISGDETMRDAALAAGADGFLAKPVPNLASLRDAILSALRLPGCPDLADDPEPMRHDPLAYRDDLATASDLLGDTPEPRTVAYAAQFLSGVARTAGDADLAAAAAALGRHLAQGAPVGTDLAQLAGLVEDRLHHEGDFSARRSA